MSNYKVLIFDWDGTLVDSIGRIVESIHVAARSCGLPQVDDTAVKGIIGLALPEAVEVLYPGQVDAARVEAFRHHYGEHYLGLEAQPSMPYPGVTEALRSSARPVICSRWRLAKGVVGSIASWRGRGGKTCSISRVARMKRQASLIL